MTSMIICVFFLLVPRKNVLGIRFDYLGFGVLFC